MAARAAIRAMTHATAVPMQRRTEDANGLRDEAQQYLDLAQALIAPRAPCLVAIGGPSGAGKSTLAWRLAASVGPAPGAVVVRSDIERKRLLGVPSHRRLAPSGYTPSVMREVYRTLAETGPPCGGLPMRMGRDRHPPGSNQRARRRRVRRDRRRGGAPSRTAAPSRVMGGPQRERQRQRVVARGARRRQFLRRCTVTASIVRRVGDAWRQRRGLSTATTVYKWPTT